ncbi:ATP-binding protein [Oligoflexus tunisiensis]|uniref:ATP-binding protein n=1 Tax=Oligoflexus tunisiensis TaxID=708132 RepID=UPI00159EFAB4|nr:ATP-binding protein [Oligoflexus tunisiensis]
MLKSLDAKRNQLQKQLDGEHARAMELLTIGMAEPVWNFDKLSAGKLTSAFAKDLRYTRIVVKSADDTVFVDLVNPAVKGASILSRKAGIQREDKDIGTVEVDISTHEMDQALNAAFLDIVLATLAQVIVSLGMVYTLLRFKVLTPLKRLVAQARKLSKKELEETFEWDGGDEIAELGCSLEFARSELKQLFAAIEKKNIELKGINQSLERIVEERTATIRTILNHVQAGFLLVDQQLHVQEGFTRSCNILLQCNVTHGVNLTSLLRLTNRDADNFKLAVDQVFEDFLPEKVSLAQIPVRHLIGESVISVEGSTVRNPQTGNVQFILFTIVDVTRLQQAEAENSKTRTLVTILKQKDAFIDFVRESMGRLESARIALSARKQTQVRTEIHTLKGNSLAFSLNEVGRYAHGIEEEAEIRIAHLEGIEQRIQEFLRSNYELLQIDFKKESEKTHQILQRDLIEMLRRFESPEIPQDLRSWIGNWASRILQRPVKQILGPLETYALELAARLGKDLNFQLEGADTLVLPETVMPVIQTLTHVVRNALDHGIEAPSERGSKPARGTIRISFADEGRQWRINIQDDGRGINVAKVKAKALENHVATAEELDRLSEYELCGLIFSDSISTADEVTDISGRGVGMAAFRNAVQSTGGELMFKNSPGQGFMLSASIPKPESLINGNFPLAA